MWLKYKLIFDAKELKSKTNVFISNKCIARFSLLTGNSFETCALLSDLLGDFLSSLLITLMAKDGPRY